MANAKIDFDALEGDLVSGATTIYSYTGGKDGNLAKVNKGDAFQGTYVEMQVGTKFNVGEPMSYKLRAENGDLFTLPACGHLNNLIGGIAPGTVIACRYNGKVAMKSRDGEAHTWELKVIK